MQCAVCVELFNLSSHKKVGCPYCQFTVGSSCAERYLLDTPSNAHCMNCRKAWSREILLESFSQKFVNKTYKERREELLLEREKALLPATQPFVEQERKKRKLTTEIVELNNTLNGVRSELAMNEAFRPNFDDIESHINHNRRSMEARKRLKCLNEDILHAEFQLGLYSRGITDNELKRKFVRACPDGDCRGFLSTAWKCGLCDKWACPECHEIRGLSRDEPHTCNPDNVATARLLDKDSKPCPKCATMIFKIVGCDQMYCTQCHTAFSWRNGTIEQGAIHNPHYYEMQRRLNGGVAPREPGDIPCGGLPHWNEVANFRSTISQDFMRLLSNMHQSQIHLQYVVLPRYRVAQEVDTRALRVRFMIGDCTETEFKRALQQKEKAFAKKQEIHDLLRTYQVVVAEIFQRMVATKCQLMPGFITEFESMRDYMNIELSKIAKRYGCVVPTIFDTFII
jgi:hypothetical protein